MATRNAVLPSTRKSASSMNRTGHITSPATPSYEEIATFMLHYTAKLPPLHPALGTAPYDYNGTDYALVLHACFPTKCIDLAALSWSPQPLEAQLLGNLAAVCAAAKSLNLPDTPEFLLEPQLLLPTASCVVHHVKFQHWLFSLSRRFPPSEGHDAVAFRAALRCRQLGEPFMKRSRGEGSTDGVVVEESRRRNYHHQQQPSDGEGYIFYDHVGDKENSTCCSSLRCTPCVPPASLAACSPYVTAAPPYTPIPDPCDSTSRAAEGEAVDSEHATASFSSSSSAAAEPKVAERPKPWLSYSKPWRVPARGATDKAKADAQSAAAAAKKRAEEEALQRKRNPLETAFTDRASTLEEQFSLSRQAAALLHAKLREVRAEFMRSLVAGYPVDYAKLSEALSNSALCSLDLDHL